MEFDLQFLLVSSKLDKKGQDILKEASASLKRLRGKIEMCDSVKRDIYTVHLLPNSSTVLPQIDLPAPPKEKTRWEKFAEEKGIKKRKKGYMMYDEEGKTHVPRYGRYSKNNLTLRSGVFEEEGDLSYKSLLKAKKERIEKNAKNMMRNIKRAEENRRKGEEKREKAKFARLIACGRGVYTTLL
jgi:regulator of ribosome biosynthesis